MDNHLIDAILSPIARKLIPHFPLTKRSSKNIFKIAKKANVPTVTAYRIIKELSKWDNIVSKTMPTHRGRPMIVYYIKSREIVINVNKDGTTIKVIQK